MQIMLSAGSLKKVELILPPPARLDAGAAEGALPRSTQRALGRLLSACGLRADFTGGLALHYNCLVHVCGASSNARHNPLKQYPCASYVWKYRHLALLYSGILTLCLLAQCPKNTFLKA